MRDLHLPGRSVVHGVNGAAATSHPLATLAALEMLRAGGNAVDGALAACAVQCVVEPMGTGLGGDCFALIAREDARDDGRAIVALNGSGRAPAGLSSEWLLERGLTSLCETSPHAVTVPGAVDAWDRLAREHGRLGLDRVLQPAIAAAEEGFAVSPRIAREWHDGVHKLHMQAGSRALFLDRGRSPAAGQVWRMPALARTLRAVAERGRAGFYEGASAAAMVRTLQALGGTHSEDDFAATACDEVEPLRKRYRGVEVLELPPNTQGILVLLMLAILEGFDLARLDPNGAKRRHLEAEATRLAVEACADAVFDPEAGTPPMADLLDPAYVAALRRRIDPERACLSLPVPPPGNPDTVYIAVVDRDRTVVSLINSLFHGFGSGIACPETGVLFHCRGLGFRVDPGHPNGVAPRRRPRHTLLPGLALRDGRPWLGFGVMGAAYQPVGQVHVLTNLVDFGLDVQEALDGPRAFLDQGRLWCERGIPDAVMAALAAMGHDTARPEWPWGGGQAVLIDREQGTLAAGSDPRKDGCALAY